jgi:hypothetical protein
MTLTRRNWIWLASAPAVLATDETFPRQPAALAKEMVGASHANLKRVKELLAQRPALVNASWDWGFGDWETALGAASHVGNKEIAETLLAGGAAPTLFSAAMLGQMAVLRAMIAARPGIERVLGPHGIPLLSHAKAGGSKEMIEYVESLPGAAGNPPRQLSEAEQKAFTGVYEYGRSANEAFEISAGKTGLMLSRKDVVNVRIHYLGENTFYPAGALAVRIRVAGGTLTILDGDSVVTAKKR